MGVKRYAVRVHDYEREGTGVMVERPEGEWISYDDHMLEVRRIDAQRRHWYDEANRKGATSIMREENRLLRISVEGVIKDIGESLEMAENFYDDITRGGLDADHDRL